MSKDTLPRDVLTRLAEIEARVNRAPKGPLDVVRDQGHSQATFRYDVIGYHADGNEKSESLVQFYEENHGEPMRAKFGAELYAHAREDIPWLVAQVRELREALVQITRANFAGPSTDERREWTWATAQKALDGADR